MQDIPRSAQSRQLCKTLHSSCTEVVESLTSNYVSHHVLQNISANTTNTHDTTFVQVGYCQYCTKNNTFGNILKMRPNIYFTISHKKGSIETFFCDCAGGPFTTSTQKKKLTRLLHILIDTINKENTTLSVGTYRVLEADLLETQTRATAGNTT